MRPIDPAELGPGEFTHLVRNCVERDGARLIVIDSLSGFFNAMPEERLLVVQLHELFTFLRQKGVVVLITLPQHGFVGPNVGTPIEVSYLADTVVLLRYFEADGEVRKAISVVKKRSGLHEPFDPRARHGLGPGSASGLPCTGSRAFSRAMPIFSGDALTLLKNRDAAARRLNASRIGFSFWRRRAGIRRSRAASWPTPASNRRPFPM